MVKADHDIIYGMPSSLICVTFANAWETSYCGQMYANEQLPRWHGQSAFLNHAKLCAAWVKQNGVQGMTETVGQVQNFSTQIL